jgi:hypothetical protein
MKLLLVIGISPDQKSKYVTTPEHHLNIIGLVVFFANPVILTEKLNRIFNIYSRKSVIAIIDIEARI